MSTSGDQNNPSQNNPNNQPKKGKGRQKVAMAKIENETNLQVTFSKRRAGLFKKASELSTLCGAESAVVVFSPGDKAHSFGHPDVETIANRFLNTNPPATSNTDPLLVARNDATIHQRNQELANIEAQLEIENQRKRELDNMRRASHNQNWSPPNIDELNYEQLQALKNSILNFKHNFGNRVKNAASLANSYEPNPEAGVEGGATWTTPTSLSNIGFPINSNIQGPSDPFAGHYRYNISFFPNGSTHSPPFQGGVGNPNVAIQTNPGASSSNHASTLPSSSFIAPFDPNLGGNPGASSSRFPAFPGSSFANPYDPNMGNYGFTVQYPAVAGPSGSNVLVPYNYGNPSNVVPYGAGTSSSNAEHDGNPTVTQAESQNNFQGFNNYRRGNC